MRISLPYGLLMIDSTITVGNIIEIGVILGGGILFLLNQRNAVGSISIQVNKMQEELKKLADVITNNAVLNQRLLNVEEDVREMKHWKGFVSPNGEWDGKRGKV